MDCYGNLSPLAKSGQQLVFNFFSFKENRLPFNVKVYDVFFLSHSLLAFTVASFIQVHFRNNSPFLQSALIISCSIHAYVHVHSYKWIILFPVISLLVYKNTAIG